MNSKTIKEILESNIVVTDSDIEQQFLNGDVWRLRWGDLAEVVVVTTDHGPFLEDVFFELAGNDGTRCIVPQCSPATDSLVERLLMLPGFDSQTFSQAMSSTDHASFLCWRRT